MRKIASIRKIDNITSIPNADSIECATVGGWEVVVKKGEFQIGQLAVYFEIDAWIPKSIAPFLCTSDKEFNGVVGAKLRTVKFRGQLSQGLLLPCPEGCNEDDDVSELLNVQKYEPPVYGLSNGTSLRGNARGNFPSCIPKTEQERVQNVVNRLGNWKQLGLTWEVTEKLEGTSLTAYILDGRFGVCSRNIDLTEDDSNLYWQVARRENLEEKLRAIGRDISIAGEVVGEGVQGNIYKIKGHEFYMFDVYDIGLGRHLLPKERLALNLDVKSVPYYYIYHTDEFASLPDILTMAEGKSALNQDVEREGIVFKCLKHNLSFKAISNKYLLKQK